MMLMVHTFLFQNRARHEQGSDEVLLAKVEKCLALTVLKLCFNLLQRLPSPLNSFLSVFLASKGAPGQCFFLLEVNKLRNNYEAIGTALKFIGQKAFQQRTCRVFWHPGFSFVFQKWNKQEHFFLNENTWNESFDKEKGGKTKQKGTQKGTKPKPMC